MAGLAEEQSVTRFAEWLLNSKKLLFNRQVDWLFWARCLRCLVVNGRVSPPSLGYFSTGGNTRNSCRTRRMTSLASGLA